MQKQPLVQERQIMLICLIDTTSSGKNNTISAHKNASSFLTLHQSCNMITFPFGYSTFVVSDLVTTLHTTLAVAF